MDYNCIFCGASFCIPCIEDGQQLSTFEGATVDCPSCERTMIIEHGELADLNAILKKDYTEMGVKIDDSVDYTKSYLEFEFNKPRDSSFESGKS